MTIFHALMAVVAGAFLLFFVIKKYWFPAVCVAISQAPFWAGWLASDGSNDPPIFINLFTDITTAAIFLAILYTFNERFLAWLAILFVCAGFVDAWAGVFTMNHYMLTHEVIHYLALIVIAGREYVEKWDRNMVSGFGRFRRYLDTRESRPLVP